MTIHSSNWLWLYLLGFFNLLVILTSAFIKVHNRKKIRGLRHIKKPLSAVLENNPFEVTKIQDIVEDLERYNIPLEVIFDLNLAIEETFTSIITNAYDDKDTHRIVLRISTEENFIKTVIEFKGREYNPLELPRPDLSLPIEEITLSGIEMHIARSKVDDIEYKRRDNTNLLILYKKIGEA